MFKMKPEVFDAINGASIEAGGLLRSTMEAGGKCGCMIGAAFVGGVYGDAVKTFNDCYDLPPALEALAPHYRDFDSAHGQLTNNPYTRLPWAEIAAEMGVVRGDA